ncbi:MAG: nucleotidyltransferase domain-containing protein [Candidatus Heimdallarchaeaceae archaeon]
MRLLNEFLKYFISELDKLSSISNIISVLLGGSLANMTITEESDIDILIICKDGCGRQILEEIYTVFKNYKENVYFDIKIIENCDIKHVNGSDDSPFFYHFVQNSKLLLGSDLRESFKIKDILCYQKVLKDIDRIREINEIFYLYDQKQIALLLLLEIAKRFVVIKTIFSHEKTTKSLSLTEQIRRLFHDEYGNIKELIKKKRKWITLYEVKGKKGEKGFDILKARKIKKMATKNYNPNFEVLLSKIISLGKNCLEVLEAQF